MSEPRTPRTPSAPTGARFRVRYATVLVVTMVALVGGPSSFLVARSYVETRAHVKTLSHAIFREVSGSLVARTQSRLALAQASLTMLESEPLAASDEGERERELVERFTGLLHSSAGFDRVAYGAADGSFVGVRRRRDESLEVTTGRGDFDPRLRAWYQEAARARHRVWVRPAGFAADRVPGVSCAAPVFDAQGGLVGVFAVDYELDSLSRFAARLVFSRRARVFVATPNGEIVARSWTEAPASSTATATHRVQRFEDLGDLVVARFGGEIARLGRMRPDERVRHLDFEHAGESWHGTVTSFEVERGIVWYVGAVAPESDFLGPVIAENRLQALAGGLGLVVAIVIAIVLARRVSSPIERLTREMERVERLELEADLTGMRSRFTELDRMGEALDRMEVGLASFARFVPKELVRSLIGSGRAAGLGGEVRELTVFFSDVAGFTTLAEDLAPDDLVRNLGAYFETLTQVLGDRRGTVDKFLGDGVMAFWGAPTDDPAHAANACVAAVLAQRELVRFAAGAEGGWMHGTHTRMGLATGPVVVGTIGTADVMNYTVMGDVANLASRLEGLSKQYGTRVLAAEATVRAAGDAVIARTVDLVAVKGKRHGIRVHELLGLPDDPDADAMRALGAATDRAFELYRSRAFAEAVAAYGEVLEMRPHDPVAAQMRARCERYAASPPPPDWSGVHVATSK